MGENIFLLSGFFMVFLYYDLKKCFFTKVNRVNNVQYKNDMHILLL